MSKPTVNLDELTFQPRPPAFAATGAAAELFDAKTAPIGRLLGAQKLGYNVTSVPAGKRAFPHHNHRINEEMFFILQGTGELRYGNEHHPIRKGDFICCPPGDAAKAHQLINTGKEDLMYLAVSTKISPEIAEYPDAGTFGLLAELQKPDGSPDMYMYVGKRTESGDYWKDQK